MRKIYLTQDKYALIDAEDFEYLNQWKWYVNFYGYAYRPITKNKWKTILMHRELLKVKKGQIVDHINHDTLDNRKNNIRLVNRSQNQWNRLKTKDSISGYKGVVFSNDGKRIKRWMARITVNNKHITLGRFLTKEKAAQIYNEAAYKYFGEYANGNII